MAKDEPSEKKQRMKRLPGIDFMRGLVMVIMALDHVRDLLHRTSLTQQPTDLNTTTPALFFTRWVTHLCAPTFVFLAGVSAFLSLKNKNDAGATQRFLFTRGLWLIVLELTVVNFGIWFDLRFSVFLFGVIAAIGCGFIVLASLLKCSLKTIGLVGLAILCLHNLAPLVISPSVLDGVPRFLLSPAACPLPNGRLFLMVYTPLPWLGIMLVGFASGRLFLLERQRQKVLFLRLGIGAIALFVLLRFINRYGDPFRWSGQKNDLYTFLSFINVTKYPPSLQFCLLFLGLLFFLLSFLQGKGKKWTKKVSVYGKVPLFYFLVHWYIIHPLLFVMLFIQGFKPSDMVFGFNYGRPTSYSGLPLWAVYLAWIGIVATMYPLCKWYAGYKEKHRGESWIRYL